MHGLVQQYRGKCAEAESEFVAALACRVPGDGPVVQDLEYLLAACRKELSRGGPWTVPEGCWHT